TVVVVHDDGQFFTVAVVPLTVIDVVPEYVFPYLVASVSRPELSDGGEIVPWPGIAVPLSVKAPQLLPEQMSEGLVPGAALLIGSLELRPNVGDPEIRY